MKNIQKIILLTTCISFMYGMEYQESSDLMGDSKRTCSMAEGEDENSVSRATLKRTASIKRASAMSRDGSICLDGALADGSSVLQEYIVNTSVSASQEGLGVKFKRASAVPRSRSASVMPSAENAATSILRTMRSVSRIESIAPKEGARASNYMHMDVANPANSYVAMLLDPEDTVPLDTLAASYVNDVKQRISDEFAPKPASHSVTPTSIHKCRLANTMSTLPSDTAHLTFFMSIKPSTISFLDKCVGLGVAQMPGDLQNVLGVYATQNPLRALLHLYKTRNTIEKWDFTFTPGSVIKQNEKLLLMGGVSVQLQQFRNSIASYFCYQLNIPYDIAGINAAACNVFHTVKDPDNFELNMCIFKQSCTKYYHRQSNFSDEVMKVFEAHHMLLYVLLTELENEKKQGNFLDLGICHIAAASKRDDSLKVQDNPIIDYFRRREFSPHVRLLSITGNKKIKGCKMSDFEKHFTDADLMLSDLMYVDQENLTKHVRISQTSSSSGSDDASSESNDLTNSSAGSASDDEVQERTVDGAGKRLRQEKK